MKKTILTAIVASIVFGGMSYATYITVFKQPLTVSPATDTVAAAGDFLVKAQQTLNDSSGSGAWTGYLANAVDGGSIAGWTSTRLFDAQWNTVSGWSVDVNSANNEIRQRYPAKTSLSATCTVGEIAISAADAASVAFCYCHATNTWKCTPTGYMDGGIGWAGP